MDELPSPFRPRPIWRRFRQDTWPGWQRAFGVFWRSRVRTPVLVLLLAAIAIGARLVVRVLPDTSGRLVRVSGEPVAGAELAMMWFTLGQYDNAETGPPSLRRSGRPDEFVTRDRALKRATVSSDADGRFDVPGGVVLVWPGSRGPFFRLAINAPDPLSGQMYPVRYLQYGERGEIVGAIDTSQESAPDDLEGALQTLRLPLPGRIQDIAVSGGRVATAEGDGGARLYALEGNELRLVSHRTASRGSFHHSAGFAVDGLALFSAREIEIVDADAGLPAHTTMSGAYDRLLASEPGRLILAAPEQVSFLAVGQEEPYQTVMLRDSARLGDRLDPHLIRMFGARIFYLHSNGSVWLTDTSSSFQAPTTLLAQNGAAVDYSLLDDGAQMFVASSRSVTLYRRSDLMQAQRIAWVDLDIGVVVMSGEVAIGERGVAVLKVAGDQLTVARQVALVSSEIEVASAVRFGDRLIVPRVENVTSRTVTVGRRRDPIAGTSRVVTRLLRDSVQLVGVEIFDVASGELTAVMLDEPLGVVLREDGLNRSLVQAVVGESRVVYGGVDGRLHVQAWSER